MGQDHSKESSTHLATPESLSHLIATRLADKCFTPLELTHFKSNFISLATTRDGIQFWPEDTLCRFLSLPDALGPGVGQVIFQMASYLGAFPFPSMAPAILTREAMVKVVVLMTERSGKVLQKGERDRRVLMFRSLAVFDRRVVEKEKTIQADELEEKKDPQKAPVQKHAPGFSADIAGFDEEDDDDGDELALAALDSLDIVDIYKTEQASQYKVQYAQIPIDNFRQLLPLLLVLAPLGAQEPLATLADRVTEDRIVTLKRVADSILWSFAPERNAGIDFHSFMRVVNHSLPYLFDGLSPLFEHFLFSKELDVNRHRSGNATLPPKPVVSAPEEPLLEQETEILTIETLSQISFFLPASSLFRNLRLLYSGAEAGFSINSISQKVINWKAPSILLVTGRRLDMSNLSQHERSFTDTLPHRALPPSSQGNSQDNKVVFGVYINVPWKQTHKEAIGDARTTMFQLEPIHDVFQPSTVNRDYVTFNLSSGIGIGNPPSKTSLASSQSLILGPVSLHLNSTLEFGVFTHDSSGGGAFSTSRSRSGSWRDIFEIESLEIWGCGGDEEARKQREAWKWEEREAAARRGITMGNDKDATYALLEMAGIVGGAGRSGGSMG